MILFLVIFFFVFTIICAKNIRYGVYTVIFSMPLYLVRFSIGGIPTTALETMIYILFLVWIFSRIKKNNFYSDLSDNFGNFICMDKNNFLLSIGITLLFLGLAISTLNSIDLRISLGIFKGWFVDPFLFFIVFISVIKKNKHIVLSLKSWIFSGVVVSLFSIFYLLNNELTFDGRLKAFFLSPNHLAMYLAPVFLIVLFFLLNIKKVSSIKYQVLSVVSIIILIPLYFTYSYGAFLGIFAGILYFVFKNGTNKRRTKIKNIYLMSFIILILSGFVFVSSNKFDQIANSENRSSFHSRLMIWNAVGKIIKDNPIFGIGPGTFQKTYLSYAEKFDEPYLEWAVPQPHNIFLSFYLQTGLIGFVGFILILFWFFKYNCRREGALFYPCGIIIVLMIYILIHGFVDTTYWKNDLALMFWLIIGIRLVEGLAIDKD